MKALKKFRWPASEPRYIAQYILVQGMFMAGLTHLTGASMAIGLAPSPCCCNAA